MKWPWSKPVVSERKKILGGAGWSFPVYVDGNDLVVENICITCFGGNGDGTNSDPQDNGDTASGKNTNKVKVYGVSLPMNGIQFPHMSASEHRALDGSPIPRMPWGTLVEVMIDGVVHTPKDGAIDLGPGRQASKPGEPHALDLTVPSAALFDHNTPYHKLSTSFFKRGNFRIIEGAKYLT